MGDGEIPRPGGLFAWRRLRAYKNHVKTNCLPIIFSMPGKEILSCFDNPALFFKIYPILEALNAIDGPGFDLHKYDSFPVQGDNIHLSLWGADISGDYAHTGGFQSGRRTVFPLPAPCGISGFF